MSLTWNAPSFCSRLIVRLCYYCALCTWNTFVNTYTHIHTHTQIYTHIHTYTRTHIHVENSLAFNIMCHRTIRPARAESRWKNATATNAVETPVVPRPDRVLQSGYILKRVYVCMCHFPRRLVFLLKRFFLPSYRVSGPGTTFSCETLIRRDRTSTLEHKKR